MAPIIRVAACHAAPIFLSASKTTEKAISLIHQASKRRANLVVFPESFIPAFPIWSALRSPTENHHLFARMARESIHADGEEIGALRAAAKELGVCISMGFSEKAAPSIATLFNSNVIIGADGQVLVHHRKLVPTFFEKLTWAPGDGHGLRVAETGGAFGGRVGALICGENTNPLARYALVALGEQVHISTWPAVWPTREVFPSLDDDGDKQHTPDPRPRNNEPQQSVTAQSSIGRSRRAANYDNVAANRIRAAAHCFEAKCFGVMCAGVLDSHAIDTIVEGSPRAEYLARQLYNAPRGATMFLDPTGAPIQSFVFNEEKKRGVEKREVEMETREYLQNEEGILYADLNLEDCVEGKQYHDLAGGYQRLDVFSLTVDRTRRRTVALFDEGEKGWTAGRPVGR